MAHWFQLEVPDESVFDTAAHRFDYRIETSVPVEAVWECLTSDESLAAWGPSVKAVRWFTPRPFGVGTRRAVTLTAGAVTVHEQFMAWEENARYAFYVFESNRPGLRRFAEDYRVTATDAGSRLDWTVVLDPTPAMRLPLKAAAPVLKAAFGRMAADGRKYFARTA